MHVVVEVLLLGASVLTLICAIGMALMRDPLQRLHFIAPPTALGAPLITLAVFLDEPQLQAGFKTAAVTFLLILINGVVTHATARAVRAHARGQWEVTPDEQVPTIRDEAKPKHGAHAPPQPAGGGAE